MSFGNSLVESFTLGLGNSELKDAGLARAIGTLQTERLAVLGGS